MYIIKSILFFATTFALCNASAVYKKLNKKCGLDDGACQKVLYGGILKEVVDNGIPEYNIPRMDPYVVKDLQLSVLGMLNVTLEDGAIAGFSTCQSNTFTTDVKTLRTNIELVCGSFSFEGTYKAESTPTLLAIIGGVNVHGEGKAKIVVENLKLNLEFPFTVKKLADCEPHIRIEPEEAVTSYEVLGKMSVEADGMFVGQQDVSTVAINIFNENWKVITKLVGPTVLNSGLNVFYTEVTKFFDAVPSKELICDDLTPYVTN
ncbi:uncharacterized protein LOC113498152 [Trichoplusia ni]|uniref:Uncharacterized protein LOC113498152 n=1 Tax=Trichoplusia ni TaxID=7111 RepID=A0A7E5VZX8_TRINI|nr:uncharacterized protein LOC113498152 [Trichoplusia ni]